MRQLIIFWIFLAIVVTSCQPKTVEIQPCVKKIDCEELSRIIVNFSTKMKIDKHLELEDSWATYQDTILNLCLKYSSQRLLTVDDARLLIVEVVEELLHRLNNNTIVRFELDHFPFTAEDIEIKINFENFYGRYIDKLYVGAVQLQAGRVNFYAFDHKDPSLNRIDWNHHRSETYSKSHELALIKKQADISYIEHRENHHPSEKPFMKVFPERYIPNEF